MNSSSQSLVSDRLRQWAVLIAIMVAIGVNFLTSQFPPQGVTVAQLATTVFAPVYFIPATYAFAIWGVIYLGLIALGFYQLQANQQQEPTLRRSGYWLVLASLAQCVWIYLFTLQLIAWSVVAMVGILVCLSILYLRLEIGAPTSRAMRWLVHMPISVYLGWITVATVVNVSVALYNLNWNGAGIAPQVWTVLLMAVSALLGITVTLQRRDVAYPLVIVWALVALVVRHLTTPLIAVSGSVLAIGVLLVALIGPAHLLRRNDH